jgi:cobalamin biosynthesis Mg chelatase CobN
MFGIGNKKTSSSTVNQTTNNYTDESANAGGDNSIAVGSGANVTFNDLSEGVAREAIRAGVDQTAFVVNTLKGITESAARETADTRTSADLALRTTQGLTQSLQESAAAAIERSQNPEATSLSKVLVPVLIAVVAALGLWFFRRRPSP